MKEGRCIAPSKPAGKERRRVPRRDDTERYRITHRRDDRRATTGQRLQVRDYGRKRQDNWHDTTPAQHNTKRHGTERRMKRQTLHDQPACQLHRLRYPSMPGRRIVKSLKICGCIWQSRWCHRWEIGQMSCRDAGKLGHGNISTLPKLVSEEIPR